MAKDPCAAEAWNFIMQFCSYTCGFSAGSVMVFLSMMLRRDGFYEVYEFDGIGGVRWGGGGSMEVQLFD